MRRYGGAIFLLVVALLLVGVSIQSFSGFFLPEEIDHVALLTTSPSQELWFRLTNPFPLRPDQRGLDDLVLLGSRSLEGLNVTIDPVSRRLVDAGPTPAAVAV